MDAMILAAGLGSRLRPLTDHTPKALVEVAGVPMLDRVAERLVAAGADRLIINVHYLGEQVMAHVATQNGYGVEANVSHEVERRLETGGGLRYAAPHFRKEAPFFMHNADILTDLDLEALYAHHTANPALATLACRPATTDRYLLFDEGGLCGYGLAGETEPRTTREAQGAVQKLDFCGVQVIDPSIFDLMAETGVFSIINVYLRLAKAGHRVQPFDARGAEWIDIGTPERLEAANQRFAK